MNWRVILNDHIRKKSYAGNYTIYGYLLSNVKFKWRILPTTKICWNPLSIPCLFPESNLYCAQLPLNLILHPNGIGNNSDLWPSVVIGTLTIFNQWNKNWCQRKRDVKKPILITNISLQFIPALFQIKNRCFLDFRCCIFPFFSKCMVLVFLMSFISSVACFIYSYRPLFPLLHVFIYSYTLFLPPIDCISFTFNSFDVYHLTCTFSISISTTVKESDSDTIIMVIVLVAGVGGVFILFALMALCYR